MSDNNYSRGEKFIDECAQFINNTITFVLENGKVIFWIFLVTIIFMGVKASCNDIATH